MEINISLIVSAIIFSGVGFVFFMHGRKQKKIEILITGLVLMIYPYFISSIMLAIIVGIVLALLPFIFRWW